jgi:hypothetical protein
VDSLEEAATEEEDEEGEEEEEEEEETQEAALKQAMPPQKPGKSPSKMMGAHDVSQAPAAALIAAKPQKGKAEPKGLKHCCCLRK